MCILTNKSIYIVLYWQCSLEVEERKKDASIYMEKTYTDQHTMENKKNLQKQQCLKEGKGVWAKTWLLSGRDWSNQCFFFLAEGLCHPPVKAQTKQINRQTVWSTDCGWSSKICRWDKRQVHAWIAQQCYPEALGCLAAAGQRGAGRSPHDSLCPAARKVSFAHSFLSPHSKQRHGIFPSARPRITLLITGLRRAQGWGTPQPSLMCLTDQKHRLWGRHVLCWTEAWADGPGMVVQEVFLKSKGSRRG